MVNFVVPHDDRWPAAFEREAAVLSRELADLRIEFHHIGSTAIPGILAKPILDMLGVVDDLPRLDARQAAFEEAGYEAMGAYGIDGRRYFRKHDESGQRTHHLHIFERGAPHVERHLAFRDYLIAHPAVAQAYSDLKARLLAGDDPSWDGYLDGKVPFIRETEAEAIHWYRSRTEPQ
ncbi:MAG: GrpB family protein [Pseudomonadota bacterium]